MESLQSNKKEENLTNSRTHSGERTQCLRRQSDRLPITGQPRDAHPVQISDGIRQPAEDSGNRISVVRCRAFRSAAPRLHKHITGC